MKKEQADLRSSVHTNAKQDDLLAASASKYCCVRGSPSDASMSSAAKPAGDELEPSAPALESMTPTLPDVLSVLKRKSLQADAQQLIQDIPVLQEWQRARNPGHKIRDAMLKLGTLWDVPRQVEGKKRPPAEVAQEIEENMLKKAKKILSGGAAAQRQMSSYFTRSSTVDAQQLPAALPMQELPLTSVVPPA